MRIALDIDRVLADFDVRLVYCLNKRYGLELIPSDIQLNDFKALFCWDTIEERAVFEEVFSSIDHFPAMEGAVEGCEILRENGVELILVTARSKREVTHQWLTSHFPTFDFPIYFKDSMDDMPLVDYFLDDSPDKIARCYDKITRQCFLMDAIQNRKCMNLGNKYQRVSGWDDFLERIQKENPNLNLRRTVYARK